MSKLAWLRTKSSDQIISACGVYRVSKVFREKWFFYRAEKHLVGEVWLTLCSFETSIEARQRCQEESEVIE